MRMGAADAGTRRERQGKEASLGMAARDAGIRAGKMGTGQPFEGGLGKGIWRWGEC